ncbi:MAG TPA: ComEC/Rec2 family competence protein, partial [Acidimicrobiales bacterium]|nr:ComEC/Rec2 family competence protein [Acidimicrobiales bacterium]
MSDRWVFVLALAAAAGACASRPVALPFATAAVALALALRRPALLCLATAVLASGLAARAWAGLLPPPPEPRPWAGAAVLATDPAPSRGRGLQFEVRLGHRRALALVRGGPGADRLRPRLAGERVRLSGTTGPVNGPTRAALAHRHVATALRVDEVGPWQPAPAPLRLANGLRRTIERGAASLPPESRALFAGFVLGDQRTEPPATRAAFRDAGLSHLLVVSGENLAFVLALAAPALRRVRLGPRLGLGLALLALFGLLTRWEPSVLRAEAMAAVALLSATLGRPVSTKRLLALAVTGLLLVDPLLVGSLGFLLSVAATAGIAWLSPALTRRLPLPIAVTLAAQLGVAPVLVPVFGGFPLASLPANLLAV